MKRHKSLIPLSQDHHNGLMLAQLIKKSAPEYKGLPTDNEGKIKYAKESWENELKYHFINEEDILFLVVSGKDEEIDRLIDELKEEHAEIEQIIAELVESADVEDSLNVLGQLLETHIRKEERILFQQLQLLCQAELEDIEGKILPANHNCKI